MIDRRLLAGCLFLLLILPQQPQAGDAPAPETNAPCLEIEVYILTGCPHCTRALAWLERIRQKYPRVTARVIEIGGDAGGRDRFFDLNRQHGQERPGTPSFYFCGQFLVGFEEAATTGAKLEQRMGLTAVSDTEAGPDEIRLPFIGSFSADRIGLPLFTIAIGLVDGFNPCAMWVLLFLLSLLVNLRNRPRMLLIAGTFVLVSGAVYFAFMAAWLNMFFIVGFSRALQVVVATIALLVGSIHIKDFLAMGKGISLSIPESAKPGIYGRVRGVIQAENFAAAMVGVIGLAVLVNFLELLCTAGLPALYTQVLAAREFGDAQYYAYLLLYNAAYIFDDALMVGIAVYTLSRYRLQETQGRWLKLLSGSTVLLLGLLLLFAPQVLL